MNSIELRNKHPTFEYHKFTTARQGNSLDVLFHFLINPGIEFFPRITIPIVESVDDDVIATFAFHLGLIESVSYWKSTCSPNMIVNAGNLNDDQVRWWHDLFINGLGEFFYKNDVDFTVPNFLDIQPNTKAPKYDSPKSAKADGDLILVGGGKDSVVTLDMLSTLSKRKNVMMLNPTVAAEKSSQIARFRDPIIINRTIDKRLLQLNEQGYLNGHTPFSAYLSFLGVFTGMLHGYENVIVSNEAGAGEGNVNFLGMNVNHQYSKSYEYEKLFREYNRRYLSGDIVYFSFLRPLYELQIAALFAKSEKYDNVFCSCNVSRNQNWCGDCPKCAFVYLALTPFMDRERRQKIFGATDFFENPAIQKHIIDLVGLGEHKPFDCVGTEDESRLAVIMALQQYQLQVTTPPQILQDLASRLNLVKDSDRALFLKKIQTDWNESHFLPKEYEQLLKERLLQL